MIPLHDRRKMIERCNSELSIEQQCKLLSIHRSGVYYKDSADKTTIDQIIALEQKKYRAKIVTEVMPLSNYFEAEQYHQKYLQKNPNGYCHIDLKSLDNDPMAKLPTR